MNRISENPVTGRKLTLAEDGDLCVYKDMQWQRLGFNERFAGKYPSCTFQDILYARDDFYAAGTADDGQAVLYSSLTGELWTPVNLTEQHYWEEKGRLPKGGAVKLFFEPCMDQILLVSAGGDVAILPECPKCVKILHLTDRTVTDAAYEDHRMTFTYESGETETFSLATADRIRVSLCFVKEALAKGGELIDVRPQHRRLQEGPIPCTAAVDPEELDDYLKNKDPDTRLFFICSFGTVADQATWHAYRLGFRNARSVGGWHRGMHID